MWNQVGRWSGVLPPRGSRWEPPADVDREYAWVSDARTAKKQGAAIKEAAEPNRTKRHGNYGLPANGGHIEVAELMAGESNAKTNRHYDRLNETSWDD